MKKERLTVVLDPVIRKMVKIKAVERNISVYEVVEECNGTCRFTIRSVKSI